MNQQMPTGRARAPASRQMAPAGVSFRDGGIADGIKRPGSALECYLGLRCLLQGTNHRSRSAVRYYDEIKPLRHFRIAFLGTGC